ncbi:serine/threonine-protein kinase [Gordonia sp. (in: high G+C Gram-positive bacteria)]|uniref:serine/threonine-protein kinase n=1 Tax=Gordonia sp. (in: high G+C Gram-positive bacteria) TaxID=84139 RepID=UPI0039E25FC3
MGDDIAGYRVVAVLGAGGMGEVYRAQHPRLPRTDAVKVLRAAHRADGAVRTRFEREADLIAPLAHPNIVRVYDRGQLGDALWIAMEWVPGTDVAKLLASHPGGLDRDRAVGIVLGVAAGLDAAHALGVTHRDVKPANILVTPGDGQVKLGDFGIARTIEDGVGVTGTGTTVGTMRYASPEQINGGPVDARSDVYSLAATTFELLTGLPPYTADSISGVMSAHLFAEVPSAHERNPGLPRAVDAVLATAMAKDPAHRYDSAGAFARDLAAAMRDETGAATLIGPSSPAEPPLAAPAQRPVPGKRRSWLVPAALLLCAALLGAGGGLWRNSASALAAPDRPDAKVTGYAVQVDWQPVDGATEYVLKRDDAVVYAGPQNTFREPLPLPGVYQYSVSARSADAPASRFSLKSTPTTVHASWRQVQWIADLYPDLVPATPLSTNGYDGVDCYANGSVYFDGSSQQMITCRKEVGKRDLAYEFAISGYPDDPKERAAAQKVSFGFRSVSQPFTSAQGNKGKVYRHQVNDTRCAGIDFGPGKRALTFVDVCVSKGTTADAVRLAQRLPM